MDNTTVKSRKDITEEYERLGAQKLVPVSKNCLACEGQAEKWDSGRVTVLVQYR
jgi:hypothetical protein